MGQGEGAPQLTVGQPRVGPPESAGRERKAAVVRGLGPSQETELSWPGRDSLPALGTKLWMAWPREERGREGAEEEYEEGSPGCEEEKLPEELDVVRS